MENEKYIIQSERLGLREWRESDLDRFAELNGSPEVMRYFHKTYTRQETKGMIDRFKSHHAEHGFCVYATDVLASGIFIGFIGFMRPRFETYFTPCVEIGWRLHNDHWNQGFATEGALACLDFGFKELGFTEVYSWTATQNAPSERIMQKIGMTKIDEFDHPNLRPDDVLKRHVLYKIKNDSLIK